MEQDRPSVLDLRRSAQVWQRVAPGMEPFPTTDPAIAAMAPQTAAADRPDIPRRTGDGPGAADCLQRSLDRHVPCPRQSARRRHGPLLHGLRRGRHAGRHHRLCG